MKSTTRGTRGMVLALALGVLSAAAMRGQEPQPELPVIGESIDVRVVNVEVVATSDGKLVRGLAAADFRLLVDGKEVPVEFFTEVAEGRTAATAPDQGAPAAPLPPSEDIGRSYLLFIDESFSVAKPRDVVLASLEADLKLMQPKDEMAVLAFNGTSMEVLSPWTSDKGALAEALRKARQRKAKGNQLLAQHRSLASDTSIALEGAAAEELNARETAELLELLGSRNSPEARTQLGKTALAMATTLRGFEIPVGRKVMLLLSGGWSVGVAPQLFGPVVAAANQLGYTIYPVDVANPTGETLRTLDRVAAQTGGKVANSVKQDVFRTVVEDTATYYWLGFTPSWKANDRQHSIKVVSKRKDVEVRARTSFPDLSRKTDNLMKAESVLLFGGVEHDRKLRVILGDAKPLGRKEVELAVTVGVPVEALALSPSGKGYVAEAPLAVAALDAQGGRADIPTARLRVAVKEVPRAGGYARFQTKLRLRQEQQRLVFTVRDEVNGNTLWQEVEFLPATGRIRK